MAFRTLMQRYQAQVYRTIRRIVLDHQDADDLTQEVFVRVWHKLADFREEARLSTWLYRIAVNEGLSFLRSKRRVTWLPLGEATEHLMAKMDTALLPDADEIERRFQAALIRLPERQRMVFQLRYYDEMKYEDMARVLDLSEGALKASYHHALKKMERYLTEDKPND
jgi:RNA polymerase sigma factor (sigma-70 family)